MLKTGSYIHSKSNRPYTLLQTDILHSETLEPHVLYQAEYGDRKIWIRPQHMWEQEVEIEEPTGSGESITRKVPRFRPDNRFPGVSKPVKPGVVCDVSVVENPTEAE